ncbi:MAG: AIR synthase related protein [Lachnospiraceae bacterium]|nr:AIR synthase related protein [Lachnospiraceae bacterium]
METGELAESVRNRSVLRQLHIETTGIPGKCKRAFQGASAAAGLTSKSQTGKEEPEGFSAGGRPVISSAGPLPGYSDMPWCQVTAAANSLSAMGAVPAVFSLQGLLPPAYEESSLREDMKRFDEAARIENAAICHADIQVSREITAVQYFVTGIGWAAAGTTETGEQAPERMKGDTNRVALAQQELCRGKEQTLTQQELCRGEEQTLTQQELCPGQELVLTRRIALAGTAALVRAHEEALQQRFPFRLVDRARGFGQWMSVTEAARAVNHFGPYPMLALSQGGIFNALWEMAEQTGVGLEVDLKKIPIYQETVEICEYFDINPYYLYSAGALLIGTDRAEDLIAMLREKDIPACVIGRVTDKKDRVILNGENRRYLDRPKRDELWRFETK